MTKLAASEAKNTNTGATYKVKEAHVVTDFGTESFQVEVLPVAAFHFDFWTQPKDDHRDIRVGGGFERVALRVGPVLGRGLARSLHRRGRRR